jgi:hypothetical protein
MKVIIKNGTLVFKSQNINAEYNEGILTLENKGINYSSGMDTSNDNLKRLRSTNLVQVKSGMDITLRGLTSSGKTLIFFYWLYNADGTPVKGFFGTSGNYFMYNSDTLSNEFTIINSEGSDYYIRFCFKSSTDEEIPVSEFNITYKSRIS